MQGKQILILLILLCLSGCDRHSETDCVLDEMELLICQSPDSAYVRLQELQPQTLAWNRRQVMRYELLKAEAQNKAIIDFTTDSIMLQVADYYLNNGTPNEKMRAYYMLGSAYRDLSDSPRALECYNTAVSLCDTTSADADYRVLSSIYSQMAELYHLQSLLTEDIHCRRQSIRCSLMVGDSLYAALDMCRMAGAYILLRNDAKAEEILLKGRDLYLGAGYIKEWIEQSTILLDIYTRNPAALHKAKELIAQYEQCFSKDIPPEKRLFCYYKGLYYELLGQIDSAETQYRGVYRPEMDFVDKDPMYRGLLRVFQKKHIPDSIAKYATLFCEVNDSSIICKDREVMANMAANYDYSRYREQAAYQGLQASRARLRFLVSVFVIVLLTVLTIVVVYLVNARRKAKQRELEQLMVDYVQTKAQYHLRLRELQQLGETRKKVIEAITQELQYSQGLSEQHRIRYDEAQHRLAEINEQYEAMSQEQRTEIATLRSRIDELSRHQGVAERLTTKQDLLSVPIVEHFRKASRMPVVQPSEPDWEQLCATFSEYYPELIHDLQNHPVVTRQALRLCLLIALEFKSGDIANVMNVNIQRITNIKAEINQALFGEHTARSLSKNLTKRYNIYTQI